MTDDERRECPLLRCKRRFTTHELMLQHLYGCEHLSAAEYFCYDCQRVERFNDGKCRRCLAHPSRRHKLKSMAKNFFSSLGIKSPQSHLAACCDSSTAISADSGLIFPPPLCQAELETNEIFEMDSDQFRLQDEPNLDRPPSPLDAQMHQPTLHPPPTPPPDRLDLAHDPSAPLCSIRFDRLSLVPVELESISPLPESLVDWDPAPVDLADHDMPIDDKRKCTSSPAPVSPSSPTPGHAQPGIYPYHYTDNAYNSPIPVPERPALQVNTHGMEQYRQQTRARCKTLAPSSSVRSTTSVASTASTATTTSNISGISTATSNISPISAWSGAWTIASVDCNLASPPSDDSHRLQHLSLGDAFQSLNPVTADDQNEPHPHPHHGKNSNLPVGIPSISLHDIFSELPADCPITGTTVNPDFLASPPLSVDHLFPPQNLYTFGDPNTSSPNPSIPNTLHSIEPMRATETATSTSTMDPPPVHNLDLPLGPLNPLNHTAIPAFARRDTQGCSAAATSLVGTAWDAIQTHVAVSKSKLAQVFGNPLVAQLDTLSPRSITSAGLAALNRINAREPLSDPVQLLCFVHVAYSLSFVLDDKRTSERSRHLYDHVLAYGDLIAPDFKSAFSEVVDAIWRPADSPKTTSAACTPAVSRSSSLKDKDPDRGSAARKRKQRDSLVRVAESFLDGKSFSTLLFFPLIFFCPNVTPKLNPSF